MHSLREVRGGMPQACTAAVICEKMEPGRGPKAPIDKALERLTDKVLLKEMQEDQYVSVAFPRFLYRFGAQIGWRKRIRANGGTAKDLGKRPG